MHLRPSPVPGVAYLRTLVGGTGAWWRLIVAAVAAAVGLLVTSFAALLVVYFFRIVFIDSGYDLDFEDGIDAGEIFSLNLGLMALIPLAAGLVRLLYGVMPRWLSSHKPGLRWWWLAICVGPCVVVWSLQWGLGGVGALIERDDPIDLNLLAFMVVVFLTTPLQAAGEEYVFRGLILQGLGATRMPAWLACGLSAALFAAAHQQFDPPLFADRFLLGLALAFLAVKTGGLEAPIAIHSVFNISTFIVVGLLGETSEALDPEGASWIAPGIHGLMLAIVVPWILFLYKRRRDRLDPSVRGGQFQPRTPQYGPPPGWQPQPAPQFGPPPGWHPPYPPGPPPGWRPQPPPAGWQPQPPPPGWQPPAPPAR